MKSCFPLDVRSCECMSQTSEVGVCFISTLAYFCLLGNGWEVGERVLFISLDL